MLNFRMITAAMLTAALPFASPLAAQEAEGAAPSQDAAGQITPTPGLTADKVTETQVEAFVEALIAIEDVRAAYVPKIAAEQDAEARQDLVEEANAMVIDVVDAVENMTAADYMAIGQAAQENEALNERIMAQITIAVEQRKATE